MRIDGNPLYRNPDYSRIHTDANVISMLVTRAMSNSSKNHTFLMCRIWKMGRNLFSSLDIRDNLKVAYLGKNPTNPSINLVTGSDFMELSSLSYYFTVWYWLTASKKFELRSAGETVLVETVLQSLIDIVSFINVLFHGNNQFSRTSKHLNKCRITMKI